MRIFREKDLVETPWKNGGGVTRTIATGTDGAGPLWRLSMADVGADGPFSNFAGLTRILTVIRGDGMILSGPEGDFDAGFARPVIFDGGIPVTARLKGGPLRDLNLMFDTARCTGEASAVPGPTLIDAGGLGRICAVHAISGQVVLNGGQGRLGMGDTAIVEDAPVALALDDGDLALVMVLRPRA